MEKKKNNETKENIRELPDREHTQTTQPPEAKAAIDNPARNLPAYNPPVPNRAWTAMRGDLAAKNVVNDFSYLTPEEQAEMDNGLRD